MGGRSRAQQIELTGGGDQRVLAPLLVVEQRIEHALAHPERRDHDILRPRQPHHVLEHERRIGQQRTPRIGDHLDLRQRLRIDPVHEAGEIERLPGRDHVAMHDVERVAGLPHVQSGERTPGAPDREKGASRAGIEQLRPGERLLDDLLRFLERFGGNVLEGEAAERKGDAGLDAVAVDIGQLERAAAQIPDYAIRPMKAGDHPERAELRLALAGDQLDLGAADTRRIGNEGPAVGRVPAGRGRNHEQLRNLDPIAQHAKPAQRGQRLVHRIGGQQPGRLHLAAEPAQHLFVEDGRGTAGQPLIDHQAHRVRANVDDRDRRTTVEPALSQLLSRLLSRLLGRLGGREPFPPSFDQAGG